MKDKGAKIIGGNGIRIEMDYYPTPSEVTIALMDFLKLPPMVIWECACGEGAIVNVLERYGHKVIATDISTGTDYLTCPLQEVQAIITNPPFSLAQEFIEKSLKEAPLVAMLLKSQYWHAQKRYKIFKNNYPSFNLET